MIAARPTLPVIETRNVDVVAVSRRAPLDLAPLTMRNVAGYDTERVRR